ncbi:hypothetical protein [Streptomonospora nanhaiensis]|uniref:hypothetical protein n=1 Tax=Streptomonospora nanhaiensis TaxID=1323731 RepID=UPI001C37EE0B|nr:hypothetical protein [Streptomonospora nanhaiensis]MBV2362273.1 hypothetical protein [Streptomonospora nanhaiensis]
MTMMFDVLLAKPVGKRIAGSVTSRSDGEIHRGYLREFGLQLLLDAWRDKWVATGPLSAETEAEFTELWGLFFGRTVPVDSEGYVLDEGTGKAREPRVKPSEFYGRRVLGGGMSNGVRYVTLESEPEEFARRAADIVVSFEITGDEYWPDASFEIEVSDARYLAHITSAEYFETAFTGGLPYF